ncbi:MAG: PBECR2 nuclease fold domain-containing protein [Bacillus sp. (in: Bacteria)]|nr:PBECR2 nuclease fold domain-containing protein [Bacillus sp. (in: firmicutes)]
MHLVGKIDKDIYRCVTDDIVTDEVIITDSQIQHIKNRHPNDYERFSQYFNQILKEPDYIIEANKLDTAVILKEIVDNGENFQTVLRLCTSKEPDGYKNSIITFLKIDEKRWKRYLRTKKILYKKE